MKVFRQRLRVIFALFAILTASLVAFMVVSAFQMREIVREEIDIDQLRVDISHDSLRACEILAYDKADTSFMVRLDEMPPGGVRLDVDRTIRLGREFSDKNHAHLSSAVPLGISPLNSEDDAWFPRRPIVKVETCEDYYVDDLTHSLPYLVPEAEELLHDIAKGFRDSLEARGGGAYRVKVTSLLRTESTVKRLRRRNVNATLHSAHLYGTTFDISYSNFICDSLTVPRTTEDLKFLLAEVLREFHDRGRCWVKHERKQSCFHITLRQ